MSTRPALASAPTRPSMVRSPRRDELLAGLAFIEGTKSRKWELPELRSWFQEHLVAAGCMTAPLLVTELSAGTVALHGSSPDALASQTLLPRVLLAARLRVLTALRGLLASPTDDRFLTAAIFTGRVRRMDVEGASRWVLRPEPTATLSGIVLGLFAVDTLSHREIYDRGLCICETCDRMSFHDGSLPRTSCAEHLPGVSGVSRRVTLSQHKLGA